MSSRLSNAKENWWHLLKKILLIFYFLKRVYAEKASEFWRLDARFKINV